MQKFSYQHFRLCILRLYAAHVIAAGLWVVHIGHGAKLGLLSFQPTPAYRQAGLSDSSL